MRTFVFFLAALNSVLLSNASIVQLPLGARTVPARDKITMKSMREQFTRGLAFFYDSYDHYATLKRELDDHYEDAHYRTEDQQVELWRLTEKHQNLVAIPEAIDYRRLNDTQVAWAGLSQEIGKGVAQEAMIRGYEKDVMVHLKEAEKQLAGAFGMACSTIEAYIDQQGIEIMEESALDVAAKGKELAILGGNGALYAFGVYDGSIQFVPVEPSLPTVEGPTRRLGWRCFEDEEENADAIVPTGFFESAATGYTVLRKKHADKLRKLLANATPWPLDGKPGKPLLKLDEPSDIEELDVSNAWESPKASIMP